MTKIESRLSIVLVLLFILSIGESGYCKELKTTGTFSNLRFDTSTGDLMGLEIHISPGLDGDYAVLQRATGEPREPIVLPIHWVDKKNGKFEISIDTPKYYAGKISGKINSNEMKLEYTHKQGGKEIETLPRRRSYWD